MKETVDRRKGEGGRFFWLKEHEEGHDKECFKCDREREKERRNEGTKRKQTEKREMVSSWSDDEMEGVVVTWEKLIVMAVGAIE